MQMLIREHLKLFASHRANRFLFARQNSVHDFKMRLGGCFHVEARMVIPHVADEQKRKQRYCDLRKDSRDESIAGEAPKSLMKLKITLEEGLNVFALARFFHLFDALFEFLDFALRGDFGGEFHRKHFEFGTNPE